MKSQFIWAATTGLFLLTGPAVATAQDTDSIGQEIEKAIDDPGESKTDEDIVPENEAIEKAIDDPSEKRGDTGIIPQGSKSKQKKEGAIDRPNESPTDEDVVPRRDIKRTQEKVEEKAREAEKATERAIDDPNESRSDEDIVPRRDIERTGEKLKKQGREIEEETERAIDDPKESRSDEDVIPQRDMERTREKIEQKGREAEGATERAIDDPNEGRGDQGLTPQGSLAPAPQEAIVPEPTQARREPKPRNLGLQVGLGVANYNGDLADNVDPGVGWDMRATFMNDQIVGGELAYTGAANNLEGEDPGRPRVDLDGTALTSAGDAMARLNMTRNAAVQPFVTAGLGVLGLDFRDDDTTVDQGSALTIPVGAGVQIYTPGRLTFGGRFNYRVLTDVIDNDLPSGDNWNVGLNAGATF